MASTHAIDGTIGVGFDQVTDVATHALGTTVVGDDNEIFIYGQASGAVSTGTCTVNATTYLITNTAGNYTAGTALATGEYGWVRQTAKRTL